jgi:aryl-alcohol dehydrogenase-like predicted oxidoreductase
MAKRYTKTHHLQIQTKYVGPADQTYPNPAYDLEAPLREQLEQSIYLSLHNLWFDLVYKEDAPGKESTYIDCFLLRFPLRYARQAGLAWKILEEFVPYPLRSLGVSNVSLPVLQDIYARARIKPAVVQNWFCVRTNYDVQVRAFCRQHGIQYQCFGTLTANLGLLMGEAVRGVAEGAEVASAVALYALVMDLGIVVLNGTTDVVHMKKDLDGVERVRQWAIENAGEWEKCRAGFAANIGEYD